MGADYRIQQAKFIRRNPLHKKVRSMGRSFTFPLTSLDSSWPERGSRCEQPPTYPTLSYRPPATVSVASLKVVPLGAVATANTGNALPLEKDVAI